MGGGPEQGFRRCFADGLKQGLVLSAAQATKKAMAPPRNSPIVQFDTTPTQSLAQPQSDLIHYTRHICARFRIDGINAIGHVVFQGPNE